MKFIKKFLLFFCLPVLILFGGVVLSKWIANIVTDRFDFETQSAHFKFYYNKSDENVISDIEKHLEDNYERITNDFNQQFDEPIEIKIYSDLESYHNAVKVHRNFFWWMGSVSDWGVGDASGRSIRMVSPLNPGRSKFTYEEILKVAVHEFTHIVTLKIVGSENYQHTSPLFSEGIAMYEARQNAFLKDMSKSEIINILPNSIEELFSWNHDNEPGKMYSFGRLFVGFIVENYGYNKFIELYKKDYTTNNFDDDIRKIYEDWIAEIKNS